MEKKRYVNKLAIGGGILLALNAIYLLIMTLCYMVPATGKVKENVGDSMSVWLNEDESIPFYDYTAYYMDNTSNMIWANLAVTDTDNPIIQSIKMVWHGADGGFENGIMNDLVGAVYYQDAPTTWEKTYSRYWMLTVGFLRVLFLFYTIKEIRYLTYAVVCTLLAAVSGKMTKELGWRALVPFATAVILRMWTINALSASLVTDVLVCSAFMLILLCNYKKDQFIENKLFFYMALGSITFAHGPLVAPLMTLGMVLTLDVLLENASDNKACSWLSAFYKCVVWMIGYAGTIFIKSALAYIVMGKEEASASFPYYMGIGQDISVRFYRIWYGIERLMAPMDVKLPLVLILFVVLIVIAVKNGIKKANSLWQLIVISLFPVAWFFVLVEHSIHNFASNVFSVFVFALLCAFTFSIKEEDKIAKQTDNHSSSGL